MEKKQEIEFIPLSLYGSNGKPEGDEVFSCKRCGACIAEPFLHQHVNWHNLIESH